MPICQNISWNQEGWLLDFVVFRERNQDQACRGGYEYVCKKMPYLQAIQENGNIIDLPTPAPSTKLTLLK